MILWPQLAFGEQPPQFDLSTPDLFAELLQDEDLQFIHLIELEPYDDAVPLTVTGIPPIGTLAFGEFDLITGGGVTRVFLSDAGFTTTPTDTRPNQHFKALVNNPLQMQRSISSEGSAISFGSIQIENGDAELDALASYDWNGRKVVVKAGAKGLPYAHFATVFSGAVEDFEFNDERIILTVRDNRIRMDQFLSVGTYAGTGNLEGGDDLAGQVKPLCFGKVLNVEPRLVDSVNLVYQVHDGSVLSIQLVRDGGVPLTPGGDVPDITAVTPSAGTYVTQLSGGYIKLGSTPAARITADVEGDNGAGYVSTAGEIVKRIAKTRLAVSPFDVSEIDDGAFNQIDMAVPGSVGIYVTDQVTASEAADALIIPLGAYWTFDRLGLLTGGVFVSPDESSIELDSTNIDIEGPEKVSSIPPAWRISVGYAPLGVVQGEDELAGATDEADRAFLTSPYRYVTTEIQSVRDRNNRASDKTILTRLTEKADAEALLARLQQLWMVPREEFVVPVHNILYRVNQGATARLTHGRYQLGGVPFLITDIGEDAESGQTTLTLWG